MLTSVRIRTCLAVLMALAPAAVACGSTAAGDPPGSIGGASSTHAQAATGTLGAATVAPVAAGTHGRVKEIGEALATVPLRTDQRAEIEQMSAAAEARHQAGRAAHMAIMSGLADQIEQGKIDRAALQPKIDAATALMMQSHPLDKASFERLHALLDPAQRGALVDAMEAKGQERRANMHHRGGMLREWADALKLTDAQQDQIHAALEAKGLTHGPGPGAAGGENGAPKHDFKAMREQHRAMLESFRGETFTMPAFPGDPGSSGSPDKGNMADHADKMASHMIGVAETVMPLLTAEQLKLAVAKLRAHATDPNAEIEP